MQHPESIIEPAAPAPAALAPDAAPKAAAKAAPRRAAKTVEAKSVDAKVAAKPAAKAAPKSDMKPTTTLKAKVTQQAVQKPAVKAAAKAPVTAAKTATPGKPITQTEVKPKKKAEKIKLKMVRDSFTMPEAEFAIIAATKQRALDARVEAKKSQVLRLGLQLVQGLSRDALVRGLQALPEVKTGRPKKAS